MKIKNLNPLLLIIALAVTVSACTQTPLDNKKSDGQESQTNVKQEDASMDYEIVPSADDWVTFKSHVCGFEISYPAEFDWSGHCEEDYSHPEIKQKTVFYIINKKDKDNPYLVDGQMSISLIKDDSQKNNNSVDGDIEKLSFSEKLGNISWNDEVVLINNKEYVVNSMYYDNPIEGAPTRRNDIIMESGDNVYLINSFIPNDNEEMNKLFLEIIETIKFVE
jgi:hypothetical protein